jgi:hypothetical protein
MWNIMALDERMIGELKGFVKVLSLEGLNKCKLKLGIAGILASILKEHFPNMCPYQLLL